MKKKELSEAYREIASRGGKACRDKYGKEYFRQLALKRWSKKKNKE